jgi:ketosteroid isomerase-like protein
MVDTKAEGEKLMQISREWSKSAATDSIEKTLSYWADDAVVMSPGQPSMKGKNAIREMVEGTSKIPGFKISWEPLSVTVSKSGDLAYMIEQNQITVNDSLGNPHTEFNKGVSIWRKETDGSWKNIVDMWNSDPSRQK